MLMISVSVGKTDELGNSQVACVRVLILLLLLVCYSCSGLLSCVSKAGKRQDYLLAEMGRRRWCCFSFQFRSTFVVQYQL